MTVIGTDGGLLEKPLRRSYVMLGPGERLEFWADFKNFQVGNETALVSLPFEAGMMGGGMMGRGMMGGRGMGGGMMGRMRRGQGPMDIMGINEKPYDPNRIDAELEKGETELWEITADEMAHPFHVHGTAFQVLSISGQEVPFDDIGLKDVLLVEDRAEILVRVNHQGDAKIPYMFHCHILEHEDAGMMGQFTVA